MILVRTKSPRNSEIHVQVQDIIPKRKLNSGVLPEIDEKKSKEYANTTILGEVPKPIEPKPILSMPSYVDHPFSQGRQLAQPPSNFLPLWPPQTKPISTTTQTPRTSGNPPSPPQNENPMLKLFGALQKRFM